ncbi:MAG: MFS transporter, partial [Quisquiliibacterium sp.]
MSRQAAAALGAATALNLPFGTIYAFSVFLRPMEALLAIGRTQMSLVFGLATITLTLGMNLAPWLYRRTASWSVVMLCGLVSALGLWLAASATGFIQLLIGYGLMFGLGAGVGFIVVQQGVNQTVVRRRGLANGYVIAMYPLGAMIGAPVFGWAIGLWGLRPTLAGLGVTVLLACSFAAWLLRNAGVRARAGAFNSDGSAGGNRGVFLRLFGIFFLAAAAGLTVMS